MLWILAFLAFFGQENNSPDSAEIQIHSFGSCRGKQIVHSLGTVLFCIPRSMKVHREASFEGDIQDAVTVSVRGEMGKLMVRSSLTPFGSRKSTPDWFATDAAGQYSVRAWSCPGSGRDFRLNRDQRRWRMMTFPWGWTEYSGVPPNIAVQFDKVIDSVGCRPLTNR